MGVENKLSFVNMKTQRDLNLTVYFNRECVGCLGISRGVVTDLAFHLEHVFDCFLQVCVLRLAECYIFIFNLIKK